MTFTLDLAPVVKVLVNGRSAASQREPSAEQPSDASALALAAADGICVGLVWRCGGQRALKSTGVALPPPGSHPSPMPGCVALTDGGSCTCLRRQLPFAPPPLLRRDLSQQNEVKPA